MNARCMLVAWYEVGRDLVTFLTTISGLNRPTRTIGPLNWVFGTPSTSGLPIYPRLSGFVWFCQAFPRVIKHPSYGCHQTFIFPNAAIESAFLHSAVCISWHLWRLSHTHRSLKHIFTRFLLLCGCFGEAIYFCGHVKHRCGFIECRVHT